MQQLKWVGKWFGRGLGALLALLLALVLYGWFTLWRTSPQYEGTQLVESLQAEALVTRDQWGVPHIEAQFSDDAYFALGWTVAQDRLPQLELFRVLGQGRLTEVVGLWEPVIKVDLLLRTFRLHEIGQRMLRESSPEVQAAFRAYYQGVNAYLENHPLPLELALLELTGYEVQPFAEDDLTGMIGAMAMQLHSALRNDLLAERLARQVGEERLRELFPHYQGGSPAVLPSPMQIGSAALPRDPLAVLDPFLPWFGLGHSNNWAIAPERTASGAAILAHDPHLGLGIPGFFYEAHVRTPEFEIAGGMVPGLPFIAVGHNTQIAWGMTSLHADAGDYFAETLNETKTAVQFQGEWVPLETREITLQGRFSSQTFEVPYTPHGPLINEVYFESQLAGLSDQALSYRWTFLEDTEANEIEGFFQLNRAKNWNEFRLALSYFGGIAQNFAYADAQGNIGMQPTGTLPIRAQLGWRILPGADGSAEWQGVRRTLDLPYAYNPPAGWVGSANNALEEALVGSVHGYFAPGERMQRLAAVLDGSGVFSAKAMERLQLDTCYPLARPLIRTAALAETEFVIPVQEILETWNGCFTTDSVAASIFAHWERVIPEVLFADELGLELARDYRGYASGALLRKLVNGELHGWADNPQTSETETLSQALRQALRQALNTMQERYGEDWRQWQWGSLQTVQFAHPLGRFPLLDLWFASERYPSPGYRGTLLRAGSRPPNWSVGLGASIRQVIDFADLNRTSSVLPAGQSMHPFSPYFVNQSPLYARGEYHPLLLDPEEIEVNARHRLTFSP